MVEQSDRPNEGQVNMRHSNGTLSLWRHGFPVYSSALLLSDDRLQDSKQFSNHHYNSGLCNYSTFRHCKFISSRHGYEDLFLLRLMFNFLHSAVASR